MESNVENAGRADTSILCHPNWREGWRFYAAPLGIQSKACVAAVDASGAWFGFTVSAGTQEI